MHLYIMQTKLHQISRHNEPYPQLHAKSVGSLYRDLWRELNFEMSTMKHAGFDFGETY